LTREFRRSGDALINDSRQASATLFPAGWRMRNFIGKPLSYMQEQDIYQWDGTMRQFDITFE
jgi:hypothetical protein